MLVQYSLLFAKGFFSPKFYKPTNCMSGSDRLCPVHFVYHQRIGQKKIASYTKWGDTDWLKSLDCGAVLIK